MSNSNKLQHIAEQISATNNRLSKLAEPIAMLDKEIAALREHIAALNEGIASRDWTLTGSRPKNCQESHTVAQQVRGQLYAEHRQTSSSLHKLQATLVPLSRERAELRNELRRLEKAAITPDHLQSEIIRHEAELLDAQGKRKKFASTRQQAIKLRDQADTAECNELAAANKLSEAQKDSFLASPGEPSGAAEIIAKIEVAMTLGSG